LWYEICGETTYIYALGDTVKGDFESLAVQLVCLLWRNVVFLSSSKAIFSISEDVSNQTRPNKFA